MGLRKFQIVKKRSGLTLFDYFSSRVALWHDVTAISKKINSKIKSVEFFEVEYFYIEDIWIPKRGGLICINYFLEVSIFLITMKFPFQRYNIMDIIANGLKPVNDKSKHD